MNKPPPFPLSASRGAEELEAIKAKVREMEEEDEWLQELQAEARNLILKSEPRRIPGGRRSTAAPCKLPPGLTPEGCPPWGSLVSAVDTGETELRTFEMEGKSSFAGLGKDFSGIPLSSPGAGEGGLMLPRHLFRVSWLSSCGAFGPQVLVLLSLL